MRWNGRGIPWKPREEQRLATRVRAISFRHYQRKKAALDFTVLHLGDHNLTAGIRTAEQRIEGDPRNWSPPFAQADAAEVIAFARPGLT